MSGAIFPDLKGKKAVVTGGAGEIGGALCRALIRNGVEVFAFDLRESEVEGVMSKIVDVSSRDSILAAANEVYAAGPVELLVNSHGLQIRSNAMTATDEIWAKIFDVNTAGAWRCSQIFGDRMREHGGSIVNITSINGLVAAKTGAAYGASKAALNHLTKIMALELAPNLRVNAVAPTVVRSDMTADLFATDDYEQSKIDAIPLRRIATGEDVAEAALYFLSGSSRMTTGQVMAVDGGISLP